MDKIEAPSIKVSEIDEKISKKSNSTPKESKILAKFPFLQKLKSSPTFAWILFILPYVLGFLLFIVLPVVIAIFLSFTNFDTVTTPKFIGFKNYIDLFTQDSVFMQYVIPNTLRFAIIVGPIGYFLSFFLAWLLAQIPKKPRTIFSLILYSPSMTAGATMTVIWKVIFSGDATGTINAYLLDWGLISQPIQWLQSPDYLMNIMIIVSIWGSMGVGFLAMIAGVLNIDSETYEAAYIDGIRNRFQEIVYVTIPSMKPQMLFGAVMAVVGTFSAGSIGVELSGSNPTVRYSGQMILNHIQDYGLIRYEMGYAAAVSVVLLLLIWGVSRLVFKLLGEKN